MIKYLLPVAILSVPLLLCAIFLEANKKTQIDKCILQESKDVGYFKHDPKFIELVCKILVKSGNKF